MSAMDDLSVGGDRRPTSRQFPMVRWDSYGDGGTRLCIPAACGGKIYACGNCLDDDGDGKIDMDDLECLGPCDNSETDSIRRFPVATVPSAKMDCYFDATPDQEMTTATGITAVIQTKMPPISRRRKPAVRTIQR